MSHEDMLHENILNSTLTYPINSSGKLACHKEILCNFVLANSQTIYVSNQYNLERIADVIVKVNGTNWNIIISKV